MDGMVPRLEVNGNCASTSKKGEIQLIFGPMFSGKSTELIRRLKRYQVAQYRVLIVKYAKDVRYDEAGIATHCGQTLPAVSATRLDDLPQYQHYDVIGIDEGQFFSDVVDWCELAANQGKIVLVAALDGTFQRKAFSEILSLVPLAESVTKLSAVCMNCFKDAAFSKRTSTADGEKVEVIGGADKYMAVCRACYFSDVRAAASPRPALKQRNSTEKEMGVSPPPAKKMLFTDKENLVTGLAVAPSAL